jgi:SAM-dependent methyltransferase
MQMNVDSLYSRLADSYDVTLTLAGYKMPLQYFIRHIPLNTARPLRILDAGCGTGLYSLALARRYPYARIVAFDMNLKMIKKLKEKISRYNLNRRLSVFRGDMVHPLPLKTGRYDLIVTAGCLEYVRIEEAVMNLKPYLRANGYWFNSPIKDNLFGQVVGKLYHLQPYTRDRNLDVFQSHGFTLVQSVDFLALKEAHIFRKNGASSIRTDGSA